MFRKRGGKGIPPKPKGLGILPYDFMKKTKNNNILGLKKILRLQRKEIEILYFLIGELILPNKIYIRGKKKRGMAHLHRHLIEENYKEWKFKRKPVYFKNLLESGLLDCKTLEEMNDEVRRNPK